MNFHPYDVARQAITVIAALFQVTVPFAAPGISQVASATRSQIVPAGYAFLIWNLIFLLSLAYAFYQALPVNRENQVLRSVGWWVAGAFIGAGAWQLVFPARLFALAQGIIAGIFICLAVAYLLLIWIARQRLLQGWERWLVAPLLGLYFGWISVAAFVGFMATLVGVGLLGGGSSEVAVGVVLLLACGMLASAVLLFGGASVVEGSLAYAAAVIWALIAVSVNQAAAAILMASALALALVAGAAAFAWFGKRPRHFLLRL